MECVAVEKHDGSNFAFEYGNIAMLHYRSQDILASTFSQAHGWALVGSSGRIRHCGRAFTRLHHVLQMSGDPTPRIYIPAHSLLPPRDANRRRAVSARTTGGPVSLSLGTTALHKGAPEEMLLAVLGAHPSLPRPCAR